ncbi:MAG: acyl-CoA dehydrogenase family protein [Candidatus Kariarchaeaceae archaeon]
MSNGGHANAGLFLANNIVEGKPKGTNVIFVDTQEGVNTERLEEKSGLHVNPTAQLHFENVRVPKENIVATPGDGYRKVLERLMGMRLGVSMQATGGAIRALELAKQYANDRVQFGKPIIEFDGVARKIKEIEKTIPRMRAYGYTAGYALDRYYRGYIPAEIPGATGDASEKMAAESLPSVARTGIAHYYVSAAKIYNAEVVQNILYDASQIFGGAGFISEFEINKIMRDVRVLPIYEGTSEIHEFLITRASQALNLLPKFKTVSSNFEGSTVYEDFLMARFPGLVGKI